MSIATLLPGQPQGLFPQDAGQDAQLLTNLGPYTVYLDSVPSVNENSIPLPPTASIVWDYARALWVMSPGSATLSFVTNGALVDAARAATNNNITVLSKAAFNTMVSHSDFVPRFECAAYQTLIVSMTTSAVAGAIWGDVPFPMEFAWYNNDGTFLFKETFTPMLANVSAQRGISITVPIKGSLCEISHVSNGNGGLRNIDTLIVQGTSRILREAMRWVDALGGSHLASLTTYVSSSLDMEDGFSNQDGFYASQFIIDNLSRQLAFTLRVNAVSAVGRVNFQDVDTGVFYAAIDIPIRSPAFIFTTIVTLPISRPIKLTFAAPTGGGAMEFSGTWLEVNGAL